MPATAVKTAWNDGNLYFYDKDGNVIFYVDGANRAMVFASGAGLTAPTAIDATDIAAGAVTYGKVTLSAGKVFAGTKTTNIASEVDIAAAGSILVGQGAGETPAAKTLSSDVTMAATGAVTIAANAITTAKILDAAVTNAKLAAGAGLGAIVTAGLGNSAAYTKATDGAQTLVSANATKDRGVLVVAVVDETFADNGGTQTTVKVGETGTDDKCWAAATFTGATAGTIFCKGFLNTSTKAIIATVTKAVGAGTGGVSITALALPNS